MALDGTCRRAQFPMSQRVLDRPRMAPLIINPFPIARGMAVSTLASQPLAVSTLADRALPDRALPDRALDDQALDDQALDDWPKAGHVRQVQPRLEAPNG
jgi:hypothetical protein